MRNLLSTSSVARLSQPLSAGRKPLVSRLRSVCPVWEWRLVPTASRLIQHKASSRSKDDAVVLDFAGIAIDVEGGLKVEVDFHC